MTEESKTKAQLIAESKRAASSLRESDERFRNLAEHLPGVSIQGYDTTGTVFYWNRASEQVYGYTAAEAIGRNLADLIIPPDIRPHFEKALELGCDATESGEFMPSGELMLLHKDGRLVPVYSVHTVACVEGRPPALFCIDVDLSETKKTEEELRRHRDHLEELVKERTAELEAVNQGLQREVTERERVETALQESEESFRSIFEVSLIGVYRTTPDGRILAANPVAVRMLGCSSFEELAERNLEKDKVYEPGYERSEFKELMERDGQVIGLESAWVRQDGTAVFVRESAVAVRDEAGEIISYQGTLEDITERRRQEQALRESDERLRESEHVYRTLFENAPVGIGLSNWEGRVLATNDAMRDMMGYTEAEMRQLSLVDAYATPQERERLMEAVRRHGGVRDHEAKMVRKDRTPFIASFSITPVNVGGDEVFLTISEDITDRKQAELELLAYQEQLRSLSSELALVEDRERRRIATSLHDDLGQALSVARIRLGELRDVAAAGNCSDAYEQVRGLLGEAIEKVRTLTFDLGSPVLHTLGLEAAVEQLAEQLVEKHGTAVSVENSQRPLLLGDDIRIMLFQIVRELFRNIGKHANATHVTVTFEESDGFVRVTIEDDGSGFDSGAHLSQARGGGFGLFSIHERMNHVGGSFEIRSEPGRGTRAIVTAPVANLSEGATEKPNEH